MDFRIVGHPLNQSMDLDLLDHVDVDAAINNNNQVIDIPAASGEEEFQHAEHAEKGLPFWVSVSRKSGFRRLHRRGGCWYRAEVEESFAVMAEARYDAYCSRCFQRPRLMDSTSGEEANSDKSVDTEEESSSTVSESGSDGS